MRGAGWATLQYHSISMLHGMLCVTLTGFSAVRMSTGCRNAADLVRSIHPVPPGLEMDFLRISSYVGTQSSGNGTMAMQPRLPVKGRHVLVVSNHTWYLVYSHARCIYPCVDLFPNVCCAVQKHGNTRRLHAFAVELYPVDGSAKQAVPSISWCWQCPAAAVTV